MGRASFKTANNTLVRHVTAQCEKGGCMVPERGDSCESVKETFIWYHDRNVTVYIITVRVTSLR